MQIMIKSSCTQVAVVIMKYYLLKVHAIFSWNAAWLGLVVVVKQAKQQKRAKRGGTLSNRIALQKSMTRTWPVDGVLKSSTSVLRSYQY